MVERVVKDYPNIKVVGTTLRGVKTASSTTGPPSCGTDGKFYDGPNFENLEIEDRVGGGDGFARGFTYGFLDRQIAAGMRQPRRGARRPADEHHGRHVADHARRADAHRGGGERADQAIGYNPAMTLIVTDPGEQERLIAQRRASAGTALTRCGRVTTSCRRSRMMNTKPFRRVWLLFFITS